jgi:hypothetical protein
MFDELERAPRQMRREGWPHLWRLGNVSRAQRWRSRAPLAAKVQFDKGQADAASQPDLGGENAIEDEMRTVARLRTQPCKPTPNNMRKR